MLDGVHFADTCCVVALAIGADGTKVPVGLWLGDTENKTVVTALLADLVALLADLVARGLNTDGGLLVVIDGAKALATAVRKVFGEARWPDAAASLREGLEDMFTVRRLGVGGRLAASLTNTNCIESMISIARDTTRNVKRWRDGKMIKRWCAAGMLNAERSFRRLKGYRQMATFVAALARHVEAVPPACAAARVA